MSVPLYGRLPSRLSWLTWQVNGGEVTAHGLDALPDAEANEIVDWIKHLV